MVATIDRVADKLHILLIIVATIDHLMTKEIGGSVIHGLDEPAVAIKMPLSQHGLSWGGAYLAHHLVIIGLIGIQHLDAAGKSECS